MIPFLQDSDFTLWQGDSLTVLRELPEESVHVCVTSPPFYGLRDYGVAGQIGLEPSPDEWVARLVAVFREVRRVLRSDGTCWIEIGDSYAGSWGAQSRGNTTGEDKATLQGSSPLSARQIKGHPKMAGRTGSIPPGAPFKPKDLIGAPWLLAFALRADGWYLRSEIVWSKPNPMPESVSDRPTTAHSRVFLLAKSPRYFYDAEAIREPHDSRFPMEHHSRVGAGNNKRASVGGVKEGPTFTGPRQYHPAGRNRRSVWEIPTQPYPNAHFATFPQKLVEPMILAGTSERGVCPECGAPWERLVDKTAVPHPNGGHQGYAARGGVQGMSDMSDNPRFNWAVETTGWRPTCAHEAEPVPAVVLDPFAGAGTTALVARRLGRRSIGIELSPDYCQLAAGRLAQQSLLAEGAA